MPVYSLNGHTPALPESGRVWIAPGARVIGRVRLGEDVSVWFNAVLRADTEDVTIGDRSNVQDGAVMHADPGFPLTVGPDCTVGHGAILHGCTIGAGSLIGMGATIMNGAVVGRNAVVGANTLIREGQSFPDGAVVVGNPARLVKTLDPDSSMGAEAAARYVERGAQYREGLVAVDGDGE